MPLLRAADLHELRPADETANMILSADMKLRASLMRKESRCSHYRLDYPKMDDTNWRAWINIYKGAPTEPCNSKSNPSTLGRPGNPPEIRSVMNRIFFGRFTFA